MEHQAAPLCLVHRLSLIRVSLSVNWLIVFIPLLAQCNPLKDQDFMASLLLQQSRIDAINSLGSHPSQKWVPVSRNNQSPNHNNHHNQQQRQQHQLGHDQVPYPNIAMLNNDHSRHVSGERRPLGSVWSGENRTRAQQGDARPCDKQQLVREAAPSEETRRVLGARLDAANRTLRAESNAEKHEDDDHDDDDDHDVNSESGEADEPELAYHKARHKLAPGEQLLGNESVAHGSTLPPPGALESDQYDESPDSNQRQQKRQQYDDNEGPEESQASTETPPDELAERRELEAAEASEAEAENRAALAEQQRAQREIIMAQAQSEAKAIREQQEALLKQQQMQQQMLMQRHQTLFEADQRSDEKRKRKQKKAQQQLRARADESSSRQRDHSRGADGDASQQLAARHHAQQRGAEQLERQVLDSARHQFAPIDNQFSDQLDRSGAGGEPEGRGPEARQRHWRHGGGGGDAADEEEEEAMSGENSQHEPRHSDISAAASSLWPSAPTMVAPSNELAVARAPNTSARGSPQPPARPNFGGGADLLAAGQHHHYGAHYGSLEGLVGAGGYGHKLGAGGGGYFQMVESHKKGQFESAFKRGNKKFNIAGEAAQHKGHAKGHVEWHSKKGKGSQTWDYKHKNKKHYGAHDGYGGGYHHF